MRRAHGQPVAVSSRALRCVLVALLSVVIFAGAAAAANACAQDVISDWADNGTVDATYPVACYENAIAQLPEDLRSYSSAAEDISRALQQRLLDDGASNGSSSGAPSDGDDGGSGGQAPSEEPAGGGGNEPAAPEPAAVEPPPPAEAPDAGEGDALASAAGAELGDGSGSLPLPVIILLVLVGVAIVGAGTFLVLRGTRARRDGQP